MSKPIIRIHNLATDKIEDREMTDDEYAQHQTDKAKAEAEKSQAEAKAAARQAILDRLGLSEEEARLLLG